MKGIEISKGYFEEYGKPMLEEQFGAILPLLAVAYTGSGSEHYGFDDEISKDHDFEPGFCIFIPDEDVIDRRNEFLLERAYSKLPKEYCGIKRPLLSPVGGNRHGVKRISEYFTNAVGSPDGNLSVSQWLHIPDYALAEAVNGEIFFDNYGLLTEIRSRISNMPDDIRYKRIAGNLLIMAQSGQYNYTRCLLHGEKESASLAITEFVNATMKVLFLATGHYLPFYKWSFRALRSIDEISPFADKLSYVISADHREMSIAEEKSNVIEKIASNTITLLAEKGLTDNTSRELEKHAYTVNEKISNSTIRNKHILTCI